MNVRNRLIIVVVALLFNAVAMAQPSDVTTEPHASPPVNPDTGPNAAANKALVLKFFQLAFTDDKVEEAFDKYTSEDFIEHSPNMGGGRAGAIRALSKMFVPGKLSTKVISSIAQGDLVSVHFEGGVDIFRVKDGKIVEHWDG